MDWLALVPAIVLAVFLYITWEALSPIRFIKQIRHERRKRLQEWEQMTAQDKSNQDEFCD